MEARLICLLLLVVGGGGVSSSQLTAEQLTSLIPASFPTRDLSRYTVRYLSPGGADSEACLQPQPPQTEAPNATVQSCRTIRYSLSGGSRTKRNITGIDYLILVVSLGRYPFSSPDTTNESIEMRQSSNIVITRHPLQVQLSVKPVFMCAVKNYTDHNNLFFSNAENVAFLGVTFSNCGPYPTPLSIRKSNNVIIDSCIFKDNFNSGAYFALSNSTFIKNSTFENNVASSIYNETEDLSIIYISGGGLTLSFINSSNYLTVISDCIFRDNYAGINDTNRLDASQRPPLYVPRGHGGGILISFRRTDENKVLVRNCTFTNNSAELTGGGISIEFYRGLADTLSFNSSQSSSRNTVEIDNSLFENNFSGEGAAVCVNTFEAANYNKLIVKESALNFNYATRTGGAISFNIQDNIMDGDAHNIPTIERCNFTGNFCPAGGSAVSFASNARVDHVTDEAIIENCIFYENRAYVGGTLSTSRFPVSLLETNIFKENEGGAVTLMQSKLSVSGSAHFEGNSAYDGGALKLLDQSAVALSDGANVMFLNNRATRHGGAIQVVSEPLFEDLRDLHIVDRRCFIQYTETSDPSDINWNANVSFIGNSAGQDGAAIHATILDVCSIGTPRLKEDEKLDHYNNSKFLVDSGPFHFRNNTVANNSVERKVSKIATEPKFLFVSIHRQLMRAALGTMVEYQIRAEDQAGNRQQALWKFNLRDEGLFSLSAGGSNDSFIVGLNKSQNVSSDDMCKKLYNEGDDLEVLGTQKLEFQLIRAVTGSVVSSEVINFTVTCCNPGYRLIDNTCEHDRNNSILVRRDRNNEYFYIEQRYYARVMNGRLVWADIPAFARQCEQQGNLSSCLFKYDSPDEQCANNRTGFLCGKCPNGTNVDLTLSLCLECAPWHAFLIVVIVVAFAVVCALIMVFNIGIPSELRGFLFYIQVIGFVYDYVSSDITWDYHLSSVFGFTFYITLCPYPGFEAPTTAAFGILLPIVAVFMIVLYIVSARFIKHLSNKNSFDGIWFLTFIIYKFVADTCFSILRCQKVYGGDPFEYVYYYDGDYKCFSGNDKLYLSYTIVSLVLSVAIILFPLVILIISFKRFKLTLNITDVLNKDLKKSCRWWASFDLFRRLLFVSVVLLFNFFSPSYTQLALLYSGLLVFFVFACALPYTSMKANISEALVLLNLLVVSALFLNTSGPIQEGVRAYALTLLLLPFIVAFIYLVYRIVSYLWSKFSPMDLKLSCVGLMCKLLKRIGFRISFLERRVECVHHPLPASPLAEIPTPFFDDDLDEPFDVDFDLSPRHSSVYTEYREVLLDD